MLGVVGPDEPSGVQDSEVYTNAIGAQTILFAADAAAVLKLAPLPPQWLAKAAAPYLPLSTSLPDSNGTAVHPEFEGYAGGPPDCCGSAEVEEEPSSPTCGVCKAQHDCSPVPGMHSTQAACEQLGCCWHASGVAPSHHKCIKKEAASARGNETCSGPAPPPHRSGRCCIMQSAAALLQYPLGLAMSEEIKLNDLKYYEPRTLSNGFFTGDSIYSIAWLALGNTRAALTQWDAAFSHMDCVSTLAGAIILGPIERRNAVAIF